MMRFGILISFIAFHLSVSSQRSSSEIVYTAIQNLNNVINNNDTISYNSQMLFKGFGQDTFEVRNFQVSYKHNDNNPLYGYDFEIREVLENSDTLTYMVLDSVLNIIHIKSNQISEFKLPEVVDFASYLEYIRYSFIFNELLKPFLNSSNADLELMDSINQYFIISTVNDFEKQELVLDKKSFLPNKYLSTITDPEFGFNQITEIRFNYDTDLKKLPRNAFKIPHYLSLGYNHIVVGLEPSLSQAESQILSLDNQHLLLNYPFTLANGDTCRIRDFSKGYILLEFWFASCLPCIKALSETNYLMESYSNLEFEIIGVNCLDTANKKKLEERIRNKNVQIPLLFGPRNLTETLGITSYPSYYLVSPDHRIDYIKGGSEEVRIILETKLKKN